MQWHQRYRRSVGSIVGGVFIIIMMIIFMWLSITTIDRIYSYTENILSKLEKQTRKYGFTQCVNSTYSYSYNYVYSYTTYTTGNQITFDIDITTTIDINIDISNNCAEALLLYGMAIIYNITYYVQLIRRVGRNEFIVYSNTTSMVKYVTVSRINKAVSLGTTQGIYREIIDTFNVIATVNRQPNINPMVSVDVKILVVSIAIVSSSGVVSISARPI